MFYALSAGRVIYRSLTWDKVPGILRASALMTASVLDHRRHVERRSLWVLTVSRACRKTCRNVGGR